MTTNHRNPRRAALAQLKAIKDRLQWCLNRWTVAGTVYEPVEKTYTEQHTGIERAYTDSVSRKRRAEEYPENSAAEWQKLYQQACQAEREAAALAEFAAAQWRECIARQQQM